MNHVDKLFCFKGQTGLPELICECDLYLVDLCQGRIKFSF